MVGCTIARFPRRLSEFRNASWVLAKRYRIRAELLLAFWGSIGFIPGPYMVGMNPSSRLV